MAYTDEQILAKLYTTRDQMIDVRLKITLHPKPSYNIDGQEVKWAEYLKQLDTSISRLSEQIAAEEGPFEEISVGYAGP
jgi:hypothetical protein